MALPRLRRTLEEYFALERESDVRYEYFDGQITMMSRASPSHERIISDVDTQLNNQLQDGRCEDFLSNMRIEVDKRAYLYGDLSVVCGEARFTRHQGLDTLTNPTVIIEITSPSTGLFDRREKFWRYQVIDSLQEYVLVSQEQPVIEVYRRTADVWLYSKVEGLDATLTVESIGCTLSLAAVYRRVTFDRPDSMPDADA
ncbi:MAG: Uma2 family endonuclease [Chloroflexi bacterium]|nr:Uma2 family endonuclease [Chloroflexota bacterium]